MVFKIEGVVWFENMIPERKGVVFVISVGLVRIKKEGEIGDTEGIIPCEARMSDFKGGFGAYHRDTVSRRNIHRDNIHIIRQYILFGYIPTWYQPRSNTEKYIIKRLHRPPPAIREFYSRTNP